MIRKQDKKSPEGYFLLGLVEKASGRPSQAMVAFSKAVSLDAGRYDAAVELANLYALLLRHGETLNLLKRYETHLGNSPLYLDMAANIYSKLGLHANAWPLYQKASSSSRNCFHSAPIPKDRRMGRLTSKLPSPPHHAPVSPPSS